MCLLLDMPCPLFLAEMASRRGLQILQVNAKKRLDSFHYISIPFHPFFPSICLYLLHNYLSSVHASSCQGPLVYIMLFILMIKMHITMLVVWNRMEWKMQKVGVDSEPRHSTDFRTIFEIMIG